ncbi:ubiquinol-cytochrome-c reductase complex assembly factor 1 [Macrosteles quadrilineatus]|uniref:ubiquinol-cytochrome-c reductase complex assembly factor 1 n=1 Tax=Macrosteles quadrilineatus TaxID=74068 RepID=UPI0023E0B905|nr:ubiquinol-cytochrome-c reductase complex assembly factor 1 [Macrosteles quadrilineatus]
MNFYHPINIILTAERVLVRKSPLSQLQLSRVLIGRTNVCTAHKRLLYLSPNNGSVVPGKLLQVEDGIFKKILKKIKFLMLDNAKLSALGYFLYETIADKIDYLSFFNEMSMPDTFNSWFLVTELHVWMLMAKAMEYGPDGRVIRNKIVEAMWNDVNDKAKKLGPENLSAAREQTRLLGDQFQAAILAYDEGILTDDRVLASALWRRFFEKECKNARTLEIMVRYVRLQMESLDNLSEDDFKKHKIEWVPFDKT